MATVPVACAQTLDVAHHVGQRLGIECQNLRSGQRRPARHRRQHVGIADRADVALRLGDDQVGIEQAASKSVSISYSGAPSGHQAADLPVDLVARGRRPAMCERVMRGMPGHRRRIVAFVADRDQRRLQTQRQNISVALESNEAIFMPDRPRSRAARARHLPLLLPSARCRAEYDTLPRPAGRSPAMLPPHASREIETRFVHHENVCCRPMGRSPRTERSPQSL